MTGRAAARHHREGDRREGCHSQARLRLHRRNRSEPPAGRTQRLHLRGDHHRQPDQPGRHRRRSTRQHPKGGSVEVFADASSATIRRQRLGQLERNAPLPAGEYTFTNGPALLRVSGRLTPAQAAEYAAAFRS